MIRLVFANGEPLPPPTPAVLGEPITDPEEIARGLERRAAYLRNSNWLDQHWPDLLPQALGKHVAVAGQEAFVAESGEEALKRAREAHPDDEQIVLQYVCPFPGPKIYGVRG